MLQRSAVAVTCSLVIANAAMAQATATADSIADASLAIVPVNGNWLGAGQNSLQTLGSAALPCAC